MLDKEFLLNVKDHYFFCDHLIHLSYFFCEYFYSSELIFLILFPTGHAGHDEPPATSLRKVPPLCGNEDKYNLDAQIKHKVILSTVSFVFANILVTFHVEFFVF